MWPSRLRPKPGRSSLSGARARRTDQISPPRKVCPKCKGVPVMLVLSRKVNEEIVIDENISITVARIEGNRVRLGISAPASVKIRRAEIAFDSVEAHTAGFSVQCAPAP